ncbi:MAG: sugar phosphorylase [Verrucomicrobiae bacterium]|nr:sugar phosphorylase [Verrucomicrobiae bacterium]
MKLIPELTLRRIRQRLLTLYGQNAESLVERFYMMVGRYEVGVRPVRSRDRWSENDVVLITYADMVRSEGEAPLRSLKGFCEQHLTGAVKTVHLLPFYPWSSDDGFSVKAYREVESDYGTWEDVRALESSFALMFDFVLNHCSAQSSWFKDFVSGVQPWKNFFIEVDPHEDLTAVVRPRSLPLLTQTHTPRGEAHVWTTFSPDQVDLNWKHPDVLFEMLDVMFFYLSKGARILRLDAVAFLWKENGTNCLHRPETHEVVKLLRDVLSVVAPDAILLTETNVPHEENISYFGRGDEAHMVYQFALPPLLLLCLLRGDCSLLRKWAESFPALPDDCTYLNFTASHDGIGVRPLQDLATEDDLQWLVKQVTSRGGKVSTRSTPDRGDVPYELNITYSSALSEPGDPDLGDARFLCSQALALSLQGMPAVYFNSLFGALNNPEVSDDHKRGINRQKWELSELNATLADATARESAVFETYLAMLRRRANHPAFHPDGPQQVLDLGPELFGIVRWSCDRHDRILCVFNFTSASHLLPTATLEDFMEVTMNPSEPVRDVLSGLHLEVGAAGVLLDPYQAVWIKR